MFNKIDIVKIILREFNASGIRNEDIFDLQKIDSVESAENVLSGILDEQAKELFEKYKKIARNRQLIVEEKLVAFVLKFLKACHEGPFNTTVEVKSSCIKFD